MLSQRQDPRAMVGLLCSWAAAIVVAGCGAGSGETRRRLNELEQELADPAVIRDVSRYKELGREHARVQRLVGEIRRLVELERRGEEAQALVSDDDEEPELLESESSSLSLKLVE